MYGIEHACMHALNGCGAWCAGRCITTGAQGGVMTTAVRMGCILGLTWTVYGLIACMKALRRAAHTFCALSETPLS